MAQSQLANVKEELGVTEAYVEELAVALAHERETVAATQRRCDEVERHLAIAQCQVRCTRFRETLSE